MFFFWGGSSGGDETRSLCIALDCLETQYVDQAELELRNLPTSASRVLGFKVWATEPGLRVESKLIRYFFSSKHSLPSKADREVASRFSWRAA